jgi:plasmid stability protein
MPNLLIRDVPEQVVQALKRRAASHRRSVQQEMLEILEQVSEEPTVLTAAGTAAAIRTRLGEKGIRFEDSTPLIRADRDR